MNLLWSSIGRLRILGFFEGISLLILLFIAMPLKYIWDMPGMVKYVGSVHGGLFVVFILYALIVSIDKSWSFWKITLPLFISSFVPFGTMYMDHKVLKHKK